MDPEVYGKLSPLSFERNLCGKYSDAYRNGVRFRAAIAGNRKIYAFRQQLGYTLSREKTPEHQKRLRELSDLFSDKANEILKTLRRDFGEPSWETGAKLRAKPDQKAYDRYRELVCETVQLTRLSVWFWLESILGYDHSEGWAQERKEFDQFRAKTRGPLSLTACIQHARNSGRNYAGLSDPVQNSDEMAGAMFLFEYDKCKSFLGLYTKGYATAEDKKENVRELM